MRLPCLCAVPPRVGPLTPLLGSRAGVDCRTYGCRTCLRCHPLGKPAASLLPSCSLPAPRCTPARCRSTPPSPPTRWAGTWHHGTWHHGTWHVPRGTRHALGPSAERGERNVNLRLGPGTWQVARSAVTRKESHRRFQNCVNKLLSTEYPCLPLPCTDSKHALRQCA